VVAWSREVFRSPEVRSQSRPFMFVDMCLHISKYWNSTFERDLWCRVEKSPRSSKSRSFGEHMFWRCSDPEFGSSRVLM
jgi:hypothetical protein